MLQFLIIINCSSQSKQENNVRTVTRANFLSSGISYERPVGRMQSIFLQAGMSMDAAVGFSSALGNTSYFHLDPAIHIEYRYYYNYARRQEKNKRTDMNSMNYFNAIVDCYLSKRRVASSDYDEEKLRPVYSAGIGWGFQRNFSKRFSLDYSLGPGVLITRVFRPDIVGEVYP